MRTTSLQRGETCLFFRPWLQTLDFQSYLLRWTVFGWYVFRVQSYRTSGGVWMSRENTHHKRDEWWKMVENWWNMEKWWKKCCKTQITKSCDDFSAWKHINYPFFLVEKFVKWQKYRLWPKRWKNLQDHTWGWWSHLRLMIGSHIANTERTA